MVYLNSEDIQHVLPVISKGALKMEPKLVSQKVGMIAPELRGRWIAEMHISLVKCSSNFISNKEDILNNSTKATCTMNKNLMVSIFKP